MVWAIPDFGRSLASGSVSTPCATAVESFAFGAVACQEIWRTMSKKTLSQRQLFPQGRRDHEEK
jgi:hypothetical protein